MPGITYFCDFNHTDCSSAKLGGLREQLPDCRPFWSPNPGLSDGPKTNVRESLSTVLRTSGITESILRSCLPMAGASNLKFRGGTCVPIRL